MSTLVVEVLGTLLYFFVARAGGCAVHSLRVARNLLTAVRARTVAVSGVTGDGPWHAASDEKPQPMPKAQTLYIPHRVPSAHRMAPSYSYRVISNLSRIDLV